MTQESPKKLSSELPVRVRVNSQNTAYVFPTSPSHSPAKEKPNHHPYGIKTTSTGILTRSNSNAGNAYIEHSYSPISSPANPRLRVKTGGTGKEIRGATHRYTKSLSSKTDVFSNPPPLPSPPARSSSRASSIRNLSSSENDEDTMSNLQDQEQTLFNPSDSDSVSSHPRTRSETLPSFFASPELASSTSAAPTFSNKTTIPLDPHSELTRELGLPENPKYWTPTSLSLYLGTVLSTKRDGPLRESAIIDIQIYLIKEKVTGRQFMRLSQDDIEEYVI